MSSKKKSTRGSRAGGRKSARTRGERSNRGAGPSSGSGGAGAPLAAAGGAARSIPAENAEARAQAERDEKGITRAGYVRRDIASTTTFNDVTYQAGAQREIPEAFARHLDLISVAPDASTEANRKAKFGSGKENDQDAQGKAVKSAREGASKAQRKHLESPAFEGIASPSKK